MFLLRCFIFFNIIFCYYKQDPIMMGLSGSYNTIAKGYHCVGINPANLAFEEENYIGLFGTNFSPLVGGVSILVSTDSNFFPSYLDEIIDINHDEFSYADCTDGICTYSNPDAIFTQSKAVLEIYAIDGVIGELNIANIDTIQFTPLSESDLRVKILKFITATDYLLIARLTLLELPCPTIDENGNLLDEVAAGEAINYHSSIDHDQIGLINFTIGDKPRYINTLMTLANSSYDDCPNPNQNPEDIINLLSTHSITIQSYASFQVNFGEY